MPLTQNVVQDVMQFRALNSNLDRIATALETIVEKIEATEERERE